LLCIGILFFFKKFGSEGKTKPPSQVALGKDRKRNVIYSFPSCTWEG